MAGRAPIILLHVFPSFAPGGQQTRFAALAGALGPDFRHHVAAMDGECTAADALDPAWYVSFHDLAGRKSRLFSPATIGDARSLIAKTAPDILCTYNWGAIEAAIANRLGPRVAHIHYEDGFGADEAAGAQKPGRVFARRFVLKNSIVAVPSQTLEDLAVSRWGLRRRQVRYIANGIDVARFSADPRDSRDGVVVGAVGALRPEKNFPRLVRAFARADLQGRARLTIIGEGPSRGRIEAAAAASGAGARISLPGASGTPEAAYRGFDIFCLSSDTEQAPLSLMEAMAAALPIAAPDIGDIATMVSAENRPFITPAGDEGALADALGRLINDSGLRAQLGAANAAKARAAFGLDGMVAAHRALYLEAAGRGE